MDIVSVFNPPRITELGGTKFWIRAYTIADLAILAAWLDDVVPGKQNRVVPPGITDDVCEAALDSSVGWHIQVWIALRHLGVSFQESLDHALVASEIERYRFKSVIYSRRRTMRSREGQGEDIATSWWGPLVESMNEHRQMTPDQIGALTLDQIDCLLEEGCPWEKPDTLTSEQAMKIMNRMYQEAVEKTDSGVNN